MRLLSILREKVAAAIDAPHMDFLAALNGTLVDKVADVRAEVFFQKAKALELLPVPSNSFGCEGWVRVGYCVSHQTIVDSMPAWRRLAEQYARGDA